MTETTVLLKRLGSYQHVTSPRLQMGWEFEQGQTRLIPESVAADLLRDDPEGWERQSSTDTEMSNG